MGDKLLCKDLSTPLRHMHLIYYFLGPKVKSVMFDASLLCRRLGRSPLESVGQIASVLGAQLHHIISSRPFWMTQHPVRQL